MKLRNTSVVLLKPRMIPLVAFLIVAIVVLLIYIVFTENKDLNFYEKRNFLKDNTRCEQSYGHYSGDLWTKDGETVGRKCLLESNRMRVDHHKRKLPDGNVIDDWLWIDYGDRVNVLVREKESNDGKGGKFVVFEQTKYALEGASLAVVGGFIESNETPEAAAIREVKEELNFVCEKSELVHLGRYRTDVNRGLGWVNAFLALDCENRRTSGSALEVADADTKQEVQHSKRLSMSELDQEAKKGRFVEVQWSNTVSLALLYLKAQLPP